VRYLSAAEGGVSHFRYGRDNLLLTFMHARLTLGMLLRLPRLALRRRQARASGASGTVLRPSPASAFQQRRQHAQHDGADPAVPRAIAVVQQQDVARGEVVQQPAQHRGGLAPEGVVAAPGP
jgi:hypothetical protein